MKRINRLLPILLIAIMFTSQSAFALTPVSVSGGNELLSASSSTIDAKATKKTTGLYKVGGKWKYYENGNFKKTTGLVKKANANTWHYVENGVYKKATGLVKCVQPGASYGNWYFVRKGNRSKESGLVKCIQPGASYNKWYYVRNGKLKKSTGQCKCIQPGKSYGKRYYIRNGKRVAKIHSDNEYIGAWTVHSNYGADILSIIAGPNKYTYSVGLGAFQQTFLGYGYVTNDGLICDITNTDYPKNTRIKVVLKKRDGRYSKIILSNADKIFPSYGKKNLEMIVRYWD